MFSHVVIFWTNPDKPNAADDLIAGANKYLQPIPGLIHFQVGKMVGSHRPVVDQSYQVALNTVFPSKQAQDDYQVHPLHLEFIEKVFKPKGGVPKKYNQAQSSPLKFEVKSRENNVFDIALEE